MRQSRYAALNAAFAFLSVDYGTALTTLAAVTRARETDRPAGAALRQQTDPHPAPRGGCRPMATDVANFLFAESGSGQTMELGRSARTIMRPPAPRQLRYGVDFDNRPIATALTPGGSRAGPAIF